MDARSSLVAQLAADDDRRPSGERRRGTPSSEADEDLGAKALGSQASRSGSAGTRCYDSSTSL